MLKLHGLIESKFFKLEYLNPKFPEALGCIRAPPRAPPD